MNIEALLISIDEPQLERCVESIKNQTIPFNKFIHINGVCPQHEAYNKGLEQLSGDWFARVEGDHILYDFATEIMIKKIQEDRNENTVFHTFSLLDTFIQNRWSGLGIFRTEAFKDLKWPDELACDRRPWERLSLENKFSHARHRTFIGTHFDKPDDFQVFSRFYPYGLKFNSIVIGREMQNMKRLLELTGDPLYQTAIDAMLFASQRKKYPGSKNNDFARKLYDEFIGSYRQKEVNPNLQG